jgi:hypothetical protein
VEELLANLGDYFTPAQHRLIVEFGLRFIRKELESLPDRLRAAVAEYMPQTQYDHGVKGGVILAAALIEVMARGPGAPSLEGSSVAEVLAKALGGAGGRP